MKNLNTISFEIGLMGLSESNHQVSSPSWAENMLKTAFDVNLHLNKANEVSNHETFKEILKAYVQCNRLMSFMLKAYHQSEISKNEFLHYEIQLKDLMTRLEAASEKINLDLKS